MLQAIHNELTSYVNSLINDGVLNNDNLDDWHHIAFNESHYIVGHYNADQWIKEHNLNAWEVIEAVQEYEQSNFGELFTNVDSESMVNMYVYILGEEIIQEAIEEKDSDQYLTLTNGYSKLVSIVKKYSTLLYNKAITGVRQSRLPVAQLQSLVRAARRQPRSVN